MNTQYLTGFWRHTWIHDELQLADLTKAPSSNVNTFSFSAHMRWWKLCLLCTWDFNSGSQSTLKWKCLFSACIRRQQLCFLFMSASFNIWAQFSLIITLFALVLRFWLILSFISQHFSTGLPRFNCAQGQSCFGKPNFCDLHIPRSPPLGDVGYVYARKPHTDCLFRLVQACKKSVYNTAKWSQSCNSYILPFFVELASRRQSLVIKTSMHNSTCMLPYAW